MSLAELTQSNGWKSFMAKLYGIGASIVIVGALFKIQHWPYATLMLTVGLLTEAVIFFFSAFEPLHEEIDWSLVYPELAGIHGLMKDLSESAGDTKKYREQITKLNDNLSALNNVYGNMLSAMNVK